jgi:biotin carboxyl carrier protein
VIFEIELAGKKHRVETTTRGEREQWSIDGRALEADAVEVSPGVYSILVDGKSFEVRVEPFAGKLRVAAAGREIEASVRDPREWRRGRGGSSETEGRQQILAPMPGKVVRLLVATGDTVQAGQGIIVVEAMKMQNEIRSPKSGTVERLAVIEGQAVNAGEIVAIVA